MKKLCNPFMKISKSKKKSKKTTKKVKSVVSIYKITIKDDKGRKKSTLISAGNITDAMKRTLKFFNAPSRCIYQIKKVK